MRTNFDMEAFYDALNSQRQALDLTWKQVAEEAKVSASTLSRLSQNKGTDVQGLTALLKWAGLQAESFYRDGKRTKRREAESVAQIAAILRADSKLDRESANAIVAIVQAAYERFKE